MNKIEEQEYIAAIRKKYEIDETHKKLDDMEITITQIKARMEKIKADMKQIKKNTAKLTTFLQEYAEYDEDE